MKNLPYILVTFIFFVSSAIAEVRVIDSQPQSAARSGGSSLPGNQQAELFYQFQTLQQEVMMLRGLVEEQAFEIKRIKQQRLDDYLDLDRRVSAFAGGNVKPIPPASTTPVLSSNQPSIKSYQPLITNQANNPADESALYSTAYELLKQRQIDASIKGFKDHLAQFPNGGFTGNSYYWLGEIYLLKNDLPEAEHWFGDLLRQYPESRKVPDAQFKLGKVYHLQGQSDRALELLNIVVASNSDVSRLAKQYIADNF